MRKLGQVLGFEAMSLYNHVANKDDLLDGVLDLVLAETEPPSPEGDWDEAVRASAISIYAALRRHPWSSALLMTGRIRPARLRYMDSLLGRLREAGLLRGDDVLDLPPARRTHLRLRAVGSRLQPQVGRRGRARCVGHADARGLSVPARARRAAHERRHPPRRERVRARPRSDPGRPAQDARKTSRRVLTLQETWSRRRHDGETAEREGDPADRRDLERGHPESRDHRTPIHASQPRAPTRTGKGANWCTYTTWASRQQGETIRGEDILENLERRLGDRRWVLHPDRDALAHFFCAAASSSARLGWDGLRAELHAPFDALSAPPKLSPRGNLKVFEEIGLLRALSRRRARCRRRSLAGGKRSPTTTGLRVRARSERARRARPAREPRDRFHEQTRLQPEILEALDAPAATRRIWAARAHALFPSAPTRWWTCAAPAAAAVGVWPGVQRAASKLAREAITDSFMVLALPGRVLALGRNLADPYPDALVEPVDPELTALLARFEPGPLLPTIAAHATGGTSSSACTTSCTCSGRSS